MQYDLEKKIEARRKSLKFLKKDIYEGLGMTAGGYADMLKRNSTTVKTLVRLSEILEVDIAYFFSDSDDIQVSPADDAEKRILKEQIKKLEADKKFLQSTLSRVLEMKGEE